MWLADVTSILQSIPLDDKRGADLSLSLLALTQDLLDLDNGAHWRSTTLAFTDQGESCDPLSPIAHSFSLRGAAVRARWEMRDELADAEVNPAHIQQLMDTLFSILGEYRTNPIDWPFAKAILEGTRTALEEYREAL